MVKHDRIVLISLVIILVTLCAIFANFGMKLSENKNNLQENLTLLSEKNDSTVQQIKILEEEIQKEKVKYDQSNDQMDRLNNKVFINDELSVFQSAVKETNNIELISGVKFYNKKDRRVYSLIENRTVIPYCYSIFVWGDFIKDVGKVIYLNNEIIVFMEEASPDESSDTYSFDKLYDLKVYDKNKDNYQIIASQINNYLYDDENKIIYFTYINDAIKNSQVMSGKSIGLSSYEIGSEKVLSIDSGSESYMCILRGDYSDDFIYQRVSLSENKRIVKDIVLGNGED